MRRILFFSLALLTTAFVIASCGGKTELTEADSCASIPDSVPVATELLVADFPNMEFQPMANFKGGEGTLLMKMYQNGDTKVMYCAMPAGASVGYHRHEGSMEVVYVLKGEATILFDSTLTGTYAAGQAHYCPDGHGHSIANMGPDTLLIYNVVAGA